MCAFLQRGKERARFGSVFDFPSLIPTNFLLGLFLRLLQNEMAPIPQRKAEGGGGIRFIVLGRALFAVVKRWLLLE